MNKDEAFANFWNTEIVSAITGKVDVSMWGDIDRNDTAYIFMAGYKACEGEKFMKATDVKTKEDWIEYQSQLIEEGSARELKLLNQIKILLSKIVALENKHVEL